MIGIVVDLLCSWLRDGDVDGEGELLFHRIPAPVIRPHHGLFAPTTVSWVAIERRTTKAHVGFHISTALPFGFQ